MYKFLVLFFFFSLSSVSVGQNFQLNDFLSENDSLDAAVDSIFHSLSNDARVAQLLMPAVGRLGSEPDSIKALIRDNKIGGVLMLNGTVDEFSKWTTEFETLNRKHGNLPFMYSADAEPSLVNRKMLGSRTVKKANAINTIAELNAVANTISEDLNGVGINYNFAPVVDMSSNKTVGYRGFGSNPENIIPFSNAFINVTQDHNIVATAKHFPGHGLVSGDTHLALQVIDGELKELKNYPPLIENGVLSIMVAHIAVRNNKEFSTNGVPATVSKTIVTDLLRDSLNFKGLIVTDAMNMGGIIRLDDADVKAIDAGCDIVLMPVNARKAHSAILKKYQSEQVFEEKVNSAVKRIIRMKLCLGLIQS